MFVRYDPITGAILATATFAQGAQPPAHWTTIEVAAQNLGDLTDWQVVDGALVRASLDGLKEQAMAAVVAATEAFRRRYITVIAGQEMLYLEKQAEAKDYLAAGSPTDLAGYPLLAAEAGITAPTPTDLAQLWLALGDLWRNLAAQIEGARMACTQQIADAQTEEAVEQAKQAFLAAASGAMS